LKPKDIIRVEKDGKFEKKGEVIRPTSRPRGYIVKIDGQYYERNRKHLLKVKEEPADIEPEADTTRNEVQPEIQQEEEDTQPLLPEEEQEEQPLEEPKEVTAQAESPKRSRYGRILKPPKRYKDFVKT